MDELKEEGLQQLPHQEHEKQNKEIVHCGESDCPHPDVAPEHLSGQKKKHIMQIQFNWGKVEHKVKFGSDAALDQKREAFCSESHSTAEDLWKKSIWTAINLGHGRCGGKEKPKIYVYLKI